MNQFWLTVSSIGWFFPPPRTWYVHETSNDLSEDCHLSLNGTSWRYPGNIWEHPPGYHGTPSIWHFSREWCTEPDPFWWFLWIQDDPGSCEFFEGVDRVWNSPKKVGTWNWRIRNLCTVRDFEVLAEDLFWFSLTLIPCSTLKQTWILEHVDILFFLQWDDVLLDIWPWPFSGWFLYGQSGKKKLLSDRSSRVVLVTSWPATICFFSVGFGAQDSTVYKDWEIVFEKRAVFSKEKFTRSFFFPAAARTAAGARIVWILGFRVSWGGSSLNPVPLFGCEKQLRG